MGISSAVRCMCAIWRSVHAGARIISVDSIIFSIQLDWATSRGSRWLKAVIREWWRTTRTWIQLLTAAIVRRSTHDCRCTLVASKSLVPSTTRRHSTGSSSAAKMPVRRRRCVTGSSRYCSRRATVRRRAASVGGWSATSRSSRTCKTTAGRRGCCGTSSPA